MGTTRGVAYSELEYNAENYAGRRTQKHPYRSCSWPEETHDDADCLTPKANKVECPSPNRLMTRKGKREHDAEKQLQRDNEDGTYRANQKLLMSELHRQDRQASGKQ